jgi:CRP-like cAMP-binding protein
MDGLPLSDLNAVLSACIDRVYSKGEVVFDQGDPVESLFILNRGCIRISAVNPDDREKILAIYSSGILGENLLGSEKHFEARATAHELEKTSSLTVFWTRSLDWPRSSSA